MNHYKWLDKNLPIFFENIGIKDFKYYQSLITADGDKCWSYQSVFEKNGLHFYHGVAIYLLLSLSPYDSEVRSTKNGWVDPFNWIIENKDRFIEHLPPIESNE